MALPRDAMGCLRFVIVVFPDHTHLLLLKMQAEYAFRNSLLLVFFFFFFFFGFIAISRRHGCDKII